MKGCLGALSILLLAFVATIIGGYKLYTGFTREFPQHARKESVYARHGAVINTVNSVVEVSTSFHDLAARIEKSKLPEELIYLTLTKNGEDNFVSETAAIIERFKVESSHYKLIDGTGFGKVNGEDVIVIELPVNKHGVESSHIYLLDTARLRGQL